jgi:poly(3-hydroxybutyrate) depolymerase
MARANAVYALTGLLLSWACSDAQDARSLAPAEPTAAGSASRTGLPGANDPAGVQPAPTPSGSEDLNVDRLAPAGGAGAPVGPADRAPTRSMGCGQPALTSGAQTLAVGGIERTFLLDLPRSYDPDLAYPLVFGFHGATTSAARFRSAGYGNLLSALGDSAIVVHADALGTPTAWNDPSDVPFFDAMVELLEQSLCVDEARVFATGHSSGGFFTNTLGCQRGNVLRAIAPVSGGGPFGGARCTGEVAVWLAHGENDMTVPFATGEASRDGWLGRNGCSTSTTATGTPPECVDYADCNAALPVRWCVHQNGHNWPSFAPRAIWDFFRML